jgi:hypothetical protein
VIGNHSFLGLNNIPLCVCVCVCVCVCGVCLCVHTHYFCGAGAQTQDLIRSMQTLYHEPHTNPSFFLAIREIQMKTTISFLPQLE